MAKIVNDNEVSSRAGRYGDRTAVEAGSQAGTCQKNDQGADQGQQLQQTTLLAGVAEAARRLLASTDFDTAVNGALEAIALATGIDRIYILENKIDVSTDEVVAERPYEWTAPGVVRGRDISGRFPMSYASLGDWR